MIRIGIVEDDDASAALLRDHLRRYEQDHDEKFHATVMLRRLDQQLRVNQLMLDHVRTVKVPNRRLRRYLLHYVGIICGVSSVLLVREGTRGSLAERDRLWSELRAADPWLYRRMRWSAFGQITNLPGPVGRRATVMAYSVAQRAIGFS